MTFRAGHLGVAPLQRIRSNCVRFHIERGRLPAIDGVTRRALAFVGSAGKLATVRVFMAIRAFRECQWFLEISTDMALEAIQFSVLSQQRELCA